MCHLIGKATKVKNVQGVLFDFEEITQTGFLAQLRLSLMKLGEMFPLNSKLYIINFSQVVVILITSTRLDVSRLVTDYLITAKNGEKTIMLQIRTATCAGF